MEYFIREDETEYEFRQPNKSNRIPLASSEAAAAYR
jgi:hypothetical protein